MRKRKTSRERERERETKNTRKTMMEKGVLIKSSHCTTPSL